MTIEYPRLCGKNKVGLKCAAHQRKNSPSIIGLKLKKLLNQNLIETVFVFSPLLMVVSAELILGFFPWS